MLDIVLLALLAVGLHVFVKWFYPKLKRLRNETPTTWQLRWTLVSVAAFVLIFIAGIATTTSIHRLSWTDNSPPLLETLLTWAEGVDARDKVKAINSAARGAVSDLQVYLNSYAAGNPYLIVTDSSGKQGCIEVENAAVTGKTCQAVYNQANSALYTSFPGGMDEVISDFIRDRTNKGDKNPFTKLPLFVTTHTTQGDIVLTAVNSQTISITAYANNTAKPIFSAIVTVSAK
ncbi:hypothetical protein [Candidatus Magnetobacterium casense]|uniref:hypothetical protein n=1 Tax=Candidatus Magnetobacterium casense TaxID=1455061 RepID=UPI0012DBEC9D|nr:hypothetical protein [Candidatus Magnetobacterium casensis]